MKRALLLTLAMAVATNGFGQTVPEPAFEVASIREVPSLAEAQNNPQSLRVTPGTVDIMNAPLLQLILMAFDVELFQVSGPDWLMNMVEQKRFDIRATTPRGATRQQLPGMLRTLLRERFRLRSHVEARPVTAYALVVSDEGHRMRDAAPMDDLSEALPAASRDKIIADTTGTPLVAASLMGDNQIRTIATSDGLWFVSSQIMYRRRGTERRTREYDAKRMTMSGLADILRNHVDRPVIDDTRLAGVYEFAIELPTPSFPVAAAQGVGAPASPNRATIEGNPSAMSVFKAVEGLGLRLQSRRSPIDVLVIDGIERTATPN